MAMSIVMSVCVVSESGASVGVSNAMQTELMTMTIDMNHWKR